MPLDDQDRDIAVATEKPALKPPPMYQVILLNDDYTPMDFVVQVLEYFFRLEPRESDPNHAARPHPWSRRAEFSPARLLKPK